jgi:hypothetical protein
MSLATELAALFRRDLTRLVQELQAFPDERTLWECAPGVSNSAGNLSLHLEGNLREYIGRQLGGVAYLRQRGAEFAGTDLPAKVLWERIEAARELVVRVISVLSVAQLETVYPEDVLGVPLTVQQFLISLHGHLNYHLGQIDYLRRFLTQGTPIEFQGLVN